MSCATTSSTSTTASWLCTFCLHVSLCFCVYACTHSACSVPDTQSYHFHAASGIVGPSTPFATRSKQRLRALDSSHRSIWLHTASMHRVRHSGGADGVEGAEGLCEATAADQPTHQEAQGIRADCSLRIDSRHTIHDHPRRYLARKLRRSW